jgi:hypothetical protein
MSRPGIRLRAIATRLCRANTLERLVDPTLADIQAEYENAIRRGLKWESRWIWILGHIALIKVVALHGGVRIMGILRDLTGDDRRALIRTCGASALIMIVCTLLLAAVPFFNFVSRSYPNSAALALYLVPQALPLSIPVGLTFGILWGLGRVAASPRSRTILLLLAVMSSVASFTMVAWVIPAANQAFRVSMIGRPVLKGANELTLGELRQLLEPGTHEPTPVSAPSDVRSLALNYHTRWALAGSPLVLALFAVALTSRRRWSTMMLGLVGCLATFGYYVVMYEARGLGLDRTLSAFGAAWAPNIAFLIVSVAVMTLSSRGSHVAARA